MTARAPITVAKPFVRRVLAELLIGMVLIALCVSAYRTLASCDFINYDDRVYVTECGPVLQGLTSQGFAWAWSTFLCGNWHPLTWLSLELDSTLFGPSPRAFHLTNLCLHSANVLIVFLLLHSLTDAPWRSVTVAALFAVHPLHVESVAWVAERKDVLSTFFGLLAVAAYVWYARRPAWPRYLTVCIAFAASLLAKPTLVTLPVLLLLLDWWPLGRIQIANCRFHIPNDDRAPPHRSTEGSLHPPSCNSLSAAAPLLLEKLPLFVLAFASGIVTLLAQRSTGSVESFVYYPMSERIGNALYAVSAYLGQTLYPWHLAVFYPLRLQSWGAILSGAGVVSGITLFVFWLRRPAAVVGWLWFLVALVPMIGLIQVGAQARADRYTYVPHIGLFISVVWLASEFLDRARVPRSAQAALVGLVLVVLSQVTSRQVQHWHNAVSLWRHAFSVTSPSRTSLLLLGDALKHEAEEKAAFTGDKASALFEEARVYLQGALDLEPTAGEIHYDLGVVLWRLDRFDEARRHFLEAIRLEPGHAMSRQMLGVLATGKGESREAEGYFREAIDLDPANIKPRVLLGELYLRQGRCDEAAGQFAYVLDVSPQEFGALLGMGEVRLKQQRLDDAARSFAAVVALRPKFAVSYFHLGVVELLAGRPARAVPLFQNALELTPGNIMWLTHLAFALHESGQIALAQQVYQAAFRQDPGWCDAAAQVAWNLATHPESRLRDGPRALQIARIVDQAAGRPEARYLDALAAAYAAVGKYNEAAATLHRLGPPASPELLARLKQYEQRQAYYQTPAGASHR